MKTDGRALDHTTLTELRKRGVAAVQDGESPDSVAAALGVNLRTVYRWLAHYRQGGWGKLDARKRGGRPPKLDGRALRRLLPRTDHTLCHRLMATNIGWLILSAEPGPSRRQPQC